MCWMTWDVAGIIWHIAGPAWNDAVTPRCAPTMPSPIMPDSVASAAPGWMVAMNGEASGTPTPRGLHSSTFQLNVSTFLRTTRVHFSA